VSRQTSTFAEGDEAQSHEIAATFYDEAEFSDEIQTKVLRVFLLAIHCHLYSVTLRLLFLPTHATSYSLTVMLQYTFKKRRKHDRKPYPLPYGLRNPYRRLKSENSQGYSQKPQRNCKFMYSASGNF
jgi:hypothetical protein